MNSGWTGHADLVRAVTGAVRSPVAAVAVVTRDGDMTATRGTDHHSSFEIGSISKVLTGMVYSDALDRGLISQKTVLGDLLPLDPPGEVGAVPLSSLAIHRSGLPRLAPGMHPLRRTLKLWVHGENPYGDSLTDLLEQTRDVHLGTRRFRYSNLGFQLLGHAVAKAAGSSYGELVQDVLGSEFSAPTCVADLGPTDVRGVNRLGRSMQAWVGEAVAPAGGIRASISTMVSFLRSVLDGTARGLSALEPSADCVPGVGIGAGWLVVDHRGRKVTWHNGSTGGFSSWIGLDREAGVGVVVLVATHGSVDRSGFRLLTEFTTTGTMPGRRGIDGRPAA